MVNKPKKNRVGAPKKKHDEKKERNTGFTLKQAEWIIKEAQGRHVDRVEIHREMADMYISAVESQREVLPLSEE